jgi:hypothetical protein
MDEKDLQDYIDWAKRGNLSNSAAARYFELSGLAGNDFKAAMSQMPMEVSQEPYIQEQPEKQTDPYAGFIPIKEDEIKGQFDVDVDFIDSNLMQKPEEEAVGELRNKYSRYGFKFEEATPGFDFVNVTAPNGEKRKFDTSRRLMSDSDKQFYTDKAVDRNEWRFSGGDLVSFMNENMVEDAKKVNDLAKANFLETPPFLGVENIQTESKEINEASNSLQERLNQYDEFVKAHEVAILNGEQEVADGLVSEIRDQKKDLEIETSNLRGRSEAFTSNVGRYYAIKQEQGTDVGALASLFVGYGVEELVEGVTQLALLGGTMTGPLAGMMLTNSAYREKAIKDSKDVADFSDFGSFVREMAGVSDEKRNEFEGRNLATQVLSGVARSLPSFMSPSKVFNVFALTGQTLSSFNDMTSGPEWDDVSETKKTAFAAPFIFAQVALERYGFRNVKGINSFSARMLTRIFGKTVGKIGAKSFAEVVEQDISSSIARAGAVTANAFVSEAETGLLQEVSSDALKRVWNLFDEKAEFEVAETTGEYISQALTSALHEGLGGMLLGSRAAYRSTKYSFSDKEMLDLDFFRDKNFAGLREMNRSHKVSLGEMTKEEARKESQADKDLLEIMGQVPSDASVSTQKQIFRKLQREKGLKDSISKKGSRMAAKEQAELEKIQQEIKEIGETYDQLTPEQKEAELKEITKPIEDPTSGGVTVETADGEVVEITPEDATPEETQQADAAPIAEESQEGAQLSLFDESTESQPAEETQEDPEALDQQESISEPASIDIASATPESMEAAGFSTEFISLISRVQESLGGNLSRNEGDKFVNHKSLASMSKAVEGIEGTPLAFGEFVYGIANRKTGEIHLLDTNSAEFTDKVKEAAAKLSSSYKIPSAVDLVAEELVTHYLLQDFFGENGTKRKDFYNQLVKLAKTNKALANLIEGVKLDYPSSRFSSEQIQEEIIAAFFVDYVKGSNKYTNIWQKVKNWFNNQFAGKRVIKNESDLISVANNVSNIISGTSVKIDTEKKTASEAKPGDAVMSRSQGFTYLNNTEIYYDFNRQSGVEMADWTVGRPSGYTGEAKKVKVNDFYHFRNWYNKTTANQEFPGIVTNMYFLKDGKKHVVNPPKPKLDSDGNKVKMERIASFGQLKRNRQARNEAEDLELRRQYSALGKELGEIWRSSPLSLHTSLPNFTPEGATESLDFEGLVIAKKNLQAAIESGVTEEQLKEMKGRFSTVSKKDNPELFNMSGLVRLGEAGSGDSVFRGEVMFSRQAPKSTKLKITDSQFKVKVLVGNNKEGNIEDLNGSSIDIAGYDTYMPKKGEDSGMVHMGNQKFQPKKKNGKYDKEADFYGHEVVTTHLNTKEAQAKKANLLFLAGREISRLELSEGDEGVVYSGFTNLKTDAIKGNPYFTSTIVKKYKEKILLAVEKGELTEAQAVKDLEKILNSRASESISPSKFPGGSNMISQVYIPAKTSAKDSDPANKEGRDYSWSFSSLGSKSEFDQAMTFLDEFIEGTDGQGFNSAKKSFVSDLIQSKPSGSGGYKGLIFEGKKDYQGAKGKKQLKEDVEAFRQARPDLSEETAKEQILKENVQVYTSFASLIKDNRFSDPTYGDETYGKLVAFTAVPYKVVRDKNGTLVADIPLVVLGTTGDIAFKGALVAKDKAAVYPMAFLRAPISVESIMPDYSDKDAGYFSAQAAYGNLKGDVAYSRSAGRVSKKLVDMAGNKGVSTNQVLQIMGKATEAERAVLEDMMGVFAGTKYIPIDDFDAYFKGAMLQQIEETDQYSRVGIDNILAGTATRAFAATVTFAGREELYGTPLSSHFPYGTHAHLRFFNTADDPSSFYVMEMQSDSFQVGDRKGTFMDQEELMDEVYELFGVTTENMDFVKDIANNPRKQLEVFNPANITTPSRRSTLSMEIGNAPPPLAVETVTYWWDMLVKLGRLTPEEEIQEASIENLYAVAKKKEGFSEANADAALRFFAIASLKAPIDISSADARKLFEKEFFETEEAVARAGGDPVAPENLQLKHFYLNAWKPKMESVGEEIPSMFLDIQEALESEEDGVGETMRSKLETLQKYEEQKEGKSNTPVDPVKSAEKSWERQLIRESLKRAQDLEKPFVRFATEETAQEIQGWGSLDGTLGFNGDFAPITYDFGAIRKRYRKLPQTLAKMGLESKEVTDQLGNSWVQVSTPPRDQRFVMFSRSSGKNNLGDIGGAVWEQREQSRSEDLKDLWMVRLQDKYRRVFKLQEDVAKETKGQVREREDFRLAEETMYGKAAEDLDKLDGAVENLGRTLLDNGILVEELDEYLYALHAKERNAVILERSGGENEEGSGKSNEWADGVLNGLSEPRRAKLEEATALVREIQQDTRDSMVGLGLETQETIDAFEEMFKDYVPLQGIAKDEDNIEFSPYPNGRTGFSVSGRATKKAKGRFNEASNIVAQVISQNAAVRIKGRTNEALNSLFNLVKENPNENVWQILDKEENSYRDDDPNIVSVRVNGIQKAVRFKDASYAQSLRAMNLPNTNKFVKFLGTLNSWLRAAFTSRNPEFVISNFSRDIQAAVFNASAESDIEGGFLNGTGAMKRIFKMVGPSIKALTKDQVGANADPMIMKYYSEFKEDGGKTGWAYQKSLEDIASDLEIDDSGKTSAQKILGTPRRMLEFVEGINDAFENSIRLSSYIAAREGGVSRAKAAQFAKNITVNFNKQGEWGTAMNATFLFFNASVQGTARLGRSLGKIKPAERPDGSRREWYERATGAQKAATGLVLLNGMLTLLAQAGSEEDEDGVLYYNKIPDYIKERNMIIMRPDGKNYWKIPMPYGYNVFANIGTVAVETAAGDRDPLEGLAFLASAVVNAFSPISFGESSDLARKAAKSAIPTALKPFFDAFAFNETYFGGPVKAEQYPFGTPKPNSSMSFRSPEELKQFFSWINEATGGSESVPGVLDLNPDGAWYILEYYLGGMGKFVERSIETTRKIASDTEESPIDLDFNDFPMMRIIYGEPSKYYDFQKYKDREVEIKQLVKEYKTEKKEDAGDRYRSIGTLNEDLKKINKALKAVRAEKRKAKTISGYAERISKTQELMERERKLVMLFNKKYDSLRGE